MFVNASEGKSKEDVEENVRSQSTSLAINSWFNDGLEYVEQDIGLELLDDTCYDLEDESSVGVIATEFSKDSNECDGVVENGILEGSNKTHGNSISIIETDTFEPENDLCKGSQVAESFEIENNTDLIEIDTAEPTIENANKELDSDKVEESDDTKPKKHKSIKVYEYVCVIFVALTIFFGISYISWYFDNSNTHGVVSGLISETTSKHNMTVTTDKVIDDVQIGQVYDFLEVDFTPLVERNSDVSGYLKVKALEGLEYPVMQTMDNKYYLDRDIDKNKSGAGWLFIDCRNNLESAQFNTIIYGHNRVDGLMFGNLKQLLKSEISNKEDADKIYFNTRTNKMIYEICSIYVTKYDDWEYYDVDFSEKQKENFIARLNKLNQAPVFTRSDLSTMDNFLTLSTCHGSAGTEKRLVVHARLIAIE